MLLPFHGRLERDQGSHAAAVSACTGNLPREIHPTRNRLPHISGYLIWALIGHLGSLRSMALVSYFILDQIWKGHLNGKDADKEREEAAKGI